MDIQKEKEAFEKYCFEVFLMSPSDGHFDRELEDPETYENLDTHRLWALWQAKAQAVPEGFVLVPKESLKVALFWMNEDIDPWQMGGDSFSDLFEHKPILEKALVGAQEQGHE